MLSVGIFANGKYGAGWNGAIDDAGEADQRVEGHPLRRVRASSVPSSLGVVVIWTVIFGIAFAFFKIQNKLTKGGIRVTEEDEIAGLDIPEMGVAAYND